MYQQGCSTRDISRSISALIEGKYSANWVSRITSVVQEKGKDMGIQGIPELDFRET